MYAVLLFVKLDELARQRGARRDQFVELYEKKYGVHLMLAWGMTEITPIGTVTFLKSHLDSLPQNQRFDAMARHGIPLAGVDLRIVDDQGKEAPWDGVAIG